jgi:hypothetical protein
MVLEKPGADGLPLPVRCLPGTEGYASRRAEQRSRAKQYAEADNRVVLALLPGKPVR